MSPPAGMQSAALTAGGMHGALPVLGSTPLPQPFMEILDVSQAVVNQEHLWGSHLEVPRAGQTFDSRSFYVGGWALPRSAANVRVSVRVEPFDRPFSDNEIPGGELTVARADVARHFPRVAGSDRCGFWFPVDLIGAAVEFKLQVSLIVGKDSIVPLGEIQGRQRPLAPSFHSRLQPIIVTSLGRSGSTLAMRLLAAHPEIVVLRQYPFEVAPLRYWLHLLTVLCARGDQQSANPDILGQNRELVGRNPYHNQSVLEIPGLGKWLNHRFPDDVADFCLRNIDTFYQQLAEQYGNERAVYFAKKSPPCCC